MSGSTGLTQIQMLWQKAVSFAKFVVLGKRLQKARLQTRMDIMTEVKLQVRSGSHAACCHVPAGSWLTFQRRTL